MANAFKNLLGGVVGGLIGLLIFEWFLRYGLFAMIAPGGLLGVGASFFRHRFKALPLITGVAALLLGMYAEWRHWPFKADESFTYLVLHAYKFDPPDLLMILAGAALGLYLPYAQYRKAVLPL